MSGFPVRQLEDAPHLWAIGGDYWSPKLNVAARAIPGTWVEKRRHVGYPDAIELVVEGVRAAGLVSEDAPIRGLQFKHNLLVSYDRAREYQKDGIDFLVCNAGAGALLADEMGLGKGLQSVRAARALRRPTVVVCPAHVRGVWERPADRNTPERFWGEFAKWWPDAVLERPYGIKPKDALDTAADVVVVHYDIVHAWVEAIREWAGKHAITIIFDEAHALLSATSRRSKACRELAEMAAGRIALTGTPPTDYVKDLHNIIDTICPRRFGDFFLYGRRYCDGKKVDVPVAGGMTKTVWDFSGRSNIPELRRRLDWFTLRRTKRQVMGELPKLTRVMVDVEVKRAHRHAITAQIVGDKKRMRAVLDSAADGKIHDVIALAKGHLAEGQRIVVGTYRRAVCEQIANALGQIVPTQFIHGGVPITKRGARIDKLRNAKGACALVATIDSTSTGVDFTFASVVIVGELVWEPRDHAQFEARAHRYGQTEPVLVQYVIARGTGDELVMHALFNKEGNFRDLIETDDEAVSLKTSLEGESEQGLARLAAELKKMGQREARRARA